MKTEMLCQSCYAEDRRKLYGHEHLSPGETTRREPGVLKFNVICDHCYDEIPAESKVVCVTTYSYLSPYSRWEDVFIFVRDWDPDER